MLPFLTQVFKRKWGISLVNRRTCMYLMCYEWNQFDVIHYSLLFKPFANLCTTWGKCSANKLSIRMRFLYRTVTLYFQIQMIKHKFVYFVLCMFHKLVDLGAHPVHAPSKGPDYFVLTAASGVGAPPLMRLKPQYQKSWIRHWFMLKHKWNFSFLEIHHPLFYHINIISFLKRVLKYSPSACLWVSHKVATCGILSTISAIKGLAMFKVFPQ